MTRSNLALVEEEENQNQNFTSFFSSIFDDSALIEVTPHPPHMVNMARVAVLIGCLAVASAAPPNRRQAPFTLNDIPETSHLRSELARCASETVSL